MAYEEALRSITLEADASIGVFTGPPGMPGSLSPNSGKQFRFVKVTGPNQVGQATGVATEAPAGVLQNKPQAVGDAATVGIQGVSMCEAGGTVTAGDGLKVDATGRPITAVIGTDKLVGIALLSGAVGQLIPVRLLLG